MAYIPANRIITNLTCNGELVIASTGKTYYGPYYSLYNGKFYTGKNPSYSPSYELIKIEANNIITPASLAPQSIITNTNKYDNATYITIQNKPVSPKFLPNLYFPRITDEDIQLGEFTRFFTKKINQNLYTEIDKEQYNNFDSKNQDYFWEMYDLISIPWDIKGNIEQIYNTNKNIVELWENKNQKFGLSGYLNFDYLEFYIKQD